MRLISFNLIIMLIWLITSAITVRGKVKKGRRKVSGLRGKRNIRAQAVGRLMENDEFALAVGENGSRRHLRGCSGYGFWHE